MSNNQQANQLTNIKIPIPAAFVSAYWKPIIGQLVAAAGSNKAAASRLGISAPYLKNLLEGVRLPSDRTAKLIIATTNKLCGTNHSIASLENPAEFGRLISGALETSPDFKTALAVIAKQIKESQ